jgi:hypothetical protein
MQFFIETKIKIRDIHRNKTYLIKLFILYADICTGSEARLGSVVDSGCPKICHIKEGATCLNNFCLCQKEPVGPVRHCCDTCVGPLCYCPPNCDMCWALVTYIVNRVLAILWCK